MAQHSRTRGTHKCSNLSCNCNCQQYYCFHPELNSSSATKGLGRVRQIQSKILCRRIQIRRKEKGERKVHVRFCQSMVLKTQNSGVRGL